MKVTFDRTADACYIKISNRKISKTLQVTDLCNIDIDENGGVLGIELLFVSEYMNDFKSWLDLGSTAEYLNKSPITIRRWIRDGDLPSYKIGKGYSFIKEELDEYIRKSKTIMRK